MSVQQNHYQMIGARINYEEFFSLFPNEDREDLSERLEIYNDSAYEGIKNHNGLCILIDGMSGDYVFIGCVISKSTNYGCIGDYELNEGEQPKPIIVEKRIKNQLGIDIKCSDITFTFHR